MYRNGWRWYGLMPNSTDEARISGYGLLSGRKSGSNRLLFTELNHLHPHGRQTPTTAKAHAHQPFCGQPRSTRAHSSKGLVSIRVSGGVFCSALSSIVPKKAVFSAVLALGLFGGYQRNEHPEDTRLTICKRGSSINSVSPTLPLGFVTVERY